MTAGTLISIPKQYTLGELKVIFDKHHDSYTFVATVNEKYIKMILGAIYIRPALMHESTNVVGE